MKLVLFISLALSSTVHARTACTLTPSQARQFRNLQAQVFAEAITPYLAGKGVQVVSVESAPGPRFYVVTANATRLQIQSTYDEAVRVETVYDAEGNFRQCAIKTSGWTRLFVYNSATGVSLGWKDIQLPDQVIGYF